MLSVGCTENLIHVQWFMSGGQVLAEAEFAGCSRMLSGWVGGTRLDAWSCGSWTLQTTFS